MSANLSRIQEMLAQAGNVDLTAFVKKLKPAQRVQMMEDWDLWAMPFQRMPPGDWRTWIFRGGRGIGKTKTGSCTTIQVARDKRSLGGGSIAIVGRTHSEVRRNQIEGDSGILACSPHDFKPTWESGKGILTWENGVKGYALSADSPEGIRGLNPGFLWADEVRTWLNGQVTWHEVIEPAVRKGRAQLMITTSPKLLKWLMDLEKRTDSVVTTATIYDNPYLSPKALASLLFNYDGTTAGRQELLGEYIDATEGALFTLANIDQYRVIKPVEMLRVIVSIDPAVSKTATSDQTGILVIGLGKDKHGYILEDCTGKYTPSEWAEKAVALYKIYRADRIIAEINQGGDMVESTLRGVAPNIPYDSVRAWKGKMLRAEPVAALYSRGLVHHVGVFNDLEIQQTTWVPGEKSPDALDAMVHGITYLMLDEKKTPGINWGAFKV